MAETVGTGKPTQQQQNSNMPLDILAQTASNFNTWHFAVAAAALGAAIGIGLLGSKAAEATGRNPGASGPILTLSIILAALIEGIVFFAIFLAK